jgi:chaperonin GroES
MNQPSLSQPALPQLLLINDRVIVERFAIPEKTKGGLFLPPKATEVSQLATIIFIGPKQTENLRPGDIVLIKKFEGHRLELAGRLFHLLRVEDLLAKITM